jgi:hypothetical protein
MASQAVPHTSWLAGRLRLAGRLGYARGPAHGSARVPFLSALAGRMGPQVIRSAMRSQAGPKLRSQAGSRVAGVDPEWI